jgi:HEAT repeat protein
VPNDNDNRSVEDLIELLQDADPLVRIQAGFTLGALGDDAAAAVPVLVEMLLQGDRQDRKLAATTLGQIGPGAANAVPALLEVTNDEDDGLADVAVWALEVIDVTDADAEAA